jgi:hypothetical protein
MVLALNTVSGQVADVSPKMLLHPKFKDILEVVEPGQKPYVAEMFMSGTKQERAEKKTTPFKKKKKEPTFLSYVSEEKEQDDVEEVLDITDNYEEDK